MICHDTTRLVARGKVSRNTSNIRQVGPRDVTGVRARQQEARDAETSESSVTSLQWRQFRACRARAAWKFAAHFGAVLLHASRMNPGKDSSPGTDDNQGEVGYQEQSISRSSSVPGSTAGVRPGSATSFPSPPFSRSGGSAPCECHGHGRTIDN